MDRIYDHGVALAMLVLGLSLKNPSHQLPSCGVYALNEAFQLPVIRRRSFCQHDLTEICDKQQVLDRFIGSLSAYCKHTNDHFSGNSEADYSATMKLLEQACPEIRSPAELAKRGPQSAVTTPTTTAQTTETAKSTTTTSVVDTSTTATTTTAVATVPSISSSAAAGGTATDTGTGTASGTATKSNAVVPSSSGAGALPSSSNGSDSPISQIPQTTASIVPQIVAAPIQAPTLTPTMGIPTPASNPVYSFATQTYTGQAILTGSCATPMYTAFTMNNGGFIAAPVVGCDNANPGCCPSISQAAVVQSALGGSIIPLSAANSAIVQALHSAPLTVCPADYTSTASACCPIGFGLYSTQILSQNPCFSAFSDASTVPPEVTQQIASLSAQIAATQTSSPVSISIVTGSVFALSLPLQNGELVMTKKPGGLSLGAKVGIGVGAGLLAAVIGVGLLLFWARKRRGGYRAHARQDSASASTAAWADAQRRSLASTSTAPPSTAWDPRSRHTSYTSGGETAYKPAEQQYVRMPPQRGSLQPMAMSQVGQFGPGGGPNYSELSGHGNEVYEADTGGGNTYMDRNKPNYGPSRVHEMDTMGHQPQSPPPRNDWL